MTLYLVRHGEAQQETADASAALVLTPQGRADVERVAIYLAEFGIQVDLIIHSTKARARQTALILGEHLTPPKSVIESSDLGPLDDPLIWNERLNFISGSLMLVGHMPFMSKMASLLACGFADETAFAFSNATVACLEHDAGAWSITWMIGPGQIKQDK